MTSTFVFNKLKLIKSVSGRRILWDQKYEHYYNRDLAKIAWDHVAGEVGASSEECRKKWRGLRDTFMKEMKKTNLEDGKRSNWRYLNALGFLADQIKANPNPPSESIDTTFALQEDSGEEPQEEDEDSKARLKAMLLGDDPESSEPFDFEFEQKRSKKDFINPDADYHFLMSLLPSMRAIPQKRKNVVRARILEVLCEEEQNT